MKRFTRLIGILLFLGPALGYSAAPTEFEVCGACIDWYTHIQSAATVVIQNLEGNVEVVQGNGPDLIKFELAGAYDAALPDGYMSVANNGLNQFKVNVIRRASDPSLPSINTGKAMHMRVIVPKGLLAHLKVTTSDGSIKILGGGLEPGAVDRRFDLRSQTGAITIANEAWSIAKLARNNVPTLLGPSTRTRTLIYDEGGLTLHLASRNLPEFTPSPSLFLCESVLTSRPDPFQF